MIARARPEPRDQGQAALLMAIVLLVAVSAVAVTIEVGDLLNESAMARTAADAAALAGASGGRGQAASIAAANGAVLVFYAEDESGRDPDAVGVTVSVQVGRASRTARAERLVEWAHSKG